MTNFALWVPALLCVLSSVTTACAWSEARPTLLLQLSRVERARTAMEGTQRVQEFVLSASVSMAVDPAEVESPAGITAEGASPVRLDSSSSSPFEATMAVPLDHAPETAGLDPPETAGLDPPETAGLDPPETAGLDAAVGCDPSSTLCAWAYSAEEAALVAVVERHGAEL